MSKMGSPKSTVDPCSKLIRVKSRPPLALADQFTFGKRIDSPDATTLPVRLAVALLRDREGRIDIDLPVRGDLNDPEFSYNRIVVNPLVNLITKIVSSQLACWLVLSGQMGKG